MTWGALVSTVPSLVAQFARRRFGGADTNVITENEDPNPNQTHSAHNAATDAVELHVPVTTSTTTTSNSLQGIPPAPAVPSRPRSPSNTPELVSDGSGEGEGIYFQRVEE